MDSAESVSVMKPLGIQNVDAWKPVKIADDVVPLTGGLCTKPCNTQCLWVSHRLGEKDVTERFLEVKATSEFLAKAIIGQTHDKAYCKSVTVIDELRAKMEALDDALVSGDTALADDDKDNAEDNDPMNALEDLPASSKDAKSKKGQRDQ